MIFIRLSFRIPVDSEIWISSQQPLKYSVSGFKNFILTLLSYGKRRKQVHNNTKFWVFELFTQFDNDKINQIWSFQAHQPISNRLPFIMTDLMIFCDAQAWGKKMFNVLRADFIICGNHSLSLSISLNQGQLKLLHFQRITGSANKCIREANLERSE